MVQFKAPSPEYTASGDPNIGDLIPASANVTPPFWCDHGNGIRLGEGSFLNFGCTILQLPALYPKHSKDHMLRHLTKEAV